MADMANMVGGLNLEGGLDLTGNVEVNELTSLQRLNRRILRGKAFCSVSSGNSAEIQQLDAGERKTKLTQRVGGGKHYNWLNSDSVFAKMLKKMQKNRMRDHQFVN